MLEPQAEAEELRGAEPTFAEYREHVSRVTGEILEVMARVARGDFSRYCTFTGEDELGALALGVNVMISELHENAQLRRIASLEGKLREKAEQLGRTVASLTVANEELQRYKEMVDEYNRTLEQKVQERTDELSQQSAVLQRTNQELNDFTYIVSHDLKEPLRAIDAYSRFLADEYTKDLDEEGQGYVTRIRANTKRLQEFIDDLLEISRIARIQNPHEEVDARSVVEKVRDALEFTLDEKRAALRLVGDFPRLRCDRTRVYQLFLNLIENALKFSRQAPVVEVRYRDGGEEHIFSVQDNGIGIEPQYFDQIFKVFQRLHSREAYPGSGAGLTICKKIIEQHGGRIWIESTPGEGSTFSFTLPKRPPQEERACKSQK